MQSFTLGHPASQVGIESEKLRNNFQSLYSSNSGPSFSTTQSALAGTLWFDTNNLLLNVFNGVQFQPVTTGHLHSSLGSLSADDHPQYLLADGSRSLTGDLSVASGIQIDGLDLSKLVEGRATFEDMLLGGGFDRFDTALTTDPPGWTSQGSPTLATTVSTATGALGRALSILPGAADEGVVRTINVRPDHGFTLSFYAKAAVVATSKVQIAEISPATGSTTVTFADTDWTFRTIGFTPSSNAQQVQIALLGNNGLVSYDDVQVYGGEMAPGYDLAFPDQDLYVRSFQDITGTNFDLGLTVIDTGEASLTFAGESSLDKFIQYSSVLSKFLTAQTTIVGTPADEMLVRVKLGDTVGLTVTVKTITGGTTTGNVRFYWDVKGVL